MNESRSGRTLLLAVGGVVVLLATVVGFFVGANGAPSARTLLIFGRFALPMTPLTVAAYAAMLALTALVLLFGAVTVASRVEE